MKIKSLGLFVGGVVIGALGGAAVTYHYLAVKFRDEEDEEIAKAKARYDKQLEEAKKIETELRQEIAEKDATIKTLTNTAAGVTGANEPETEKKEEEQDMSGDDSSDPDPDRRQEGTSERSDPDRYWRRQTCQRVEKVAKEQNYYYDEDSEYDPDDVVALDDSPLEEDNYHEDAPPPYVISEYAFAETCTDWSKVAYSWYPYDGSVVSEDKELVDNFERYLGTEWMSELKKVGDECYVRNERLELDALITLCSGVGADNISLED